MSRVVLQRAFEKERAEVSRLPFMRRVASVLSIARGARCIRCLPFLGGHLPFTKYTCTHPQLLAPLYSLLLRLGRLHGTVHGCFGFFVDDCRLCPSEHGFLAA